MSCISLGAGLAGQQKPPELTGTLSFDVGSGSGRVETFAVQIGDGGTGRYKAILAGDPSLPTHAIYRPRDLRPFGRGSAPANRGVRQRRLPERIGEFRNFLSDVASHGYLIVAIGPAGDAVVAGSEGRTNQTRGLPAARRRRLGDAGERPPGERLSEVTWRTSPSWAIPTVPGKRSKCLGMPRVKTTVLLNGGPNPGGGRERGGGLPQTPTAAATPPSVAGSAGRPALAPVSSRHKRPAAPAAPGQPGAGNTPPAGMPAALDKMARRYAPYAPALQPVPGDASAQPAGERTLLHRRAPWLHCLHQWRTQRHRGTTVRYWATSQVQERVTALHAWQDVGPLSRDLSTTERRRVRRCRPTRGSIGN